jgi:hypothetical protein
MTQRKVSLLLAALVFATAGVGTALAGDKAGAVNAVATDSACDDPGGQSNTIYGPVAVWLHDPNQIGAHVTVTYQKTKETVNGYLEVASCSGNGWRLYLTTILATTPGTATIEVFDRFTGAKIGGDSFRVVAPAN